MRKLLTIVLIALSVSPPAFAQDNDATWRQLEGMRAGTRIHLTLKDGAEIEGLFVEARADAVVLDNTRLLNGSLSSSAGERLGERLTFLREDVAHVAGIAAGVIFLLSPPGQCIMSSTGC